MVRLDEAQKKIRPRGSTRSAARAAHQVQKVVNLLSSEEPAIGKEATARQERGCIIHHRNEELYDMHGPFALLLIQEAWGQARKMCEEAGAKELGGIKHYSIRKPTLS